MPRFRDLINAASEPALARVEQLARERILLRAEIQALKAEIALLRLRQVAVASGLEERA